MINYDDIIISVKANNNKLDTFMQYIVEECMKSQATKNSNKTLLNATFFDTKILFKKLLDLDIYI